MSPKNPTRPIDRIFRLVEYAIALCLLVMVVMVFGNVVMRYGFNSGIAVSEELSRWFFVWMTFLGAIVAMKEHGHLGTDFLVRRLGHRGKLFCLVVGHALMLWVTWLLIQGCWAQVQINRSVAAPVTGYPLAVIYMAGLAFGIPAALLLLYEMFRGLTGRMRDDEMVMVTESTDLAHLKEEAEAASGRNGSKA